VIRSQVSFGHKSLVMNEQLDTASPPAPVPAKFNDTITVDRVILRPQFRDSREALHLAQGGTGGKVHKGLLSIQAQGRILIPNLTQAASLEDRERDLRLAFDPYECHRDSPTTDGVYALSWQEPTLDTVKYPSGWMAVTRYVRPVAQPETTASINDLNRQWAVGLMAPDPQLYDTVNGSVTVDAPLADTDLVNKGSVAGPLKVTVTMAAPGAPNFTIKRSDVSFVLNLSGMVVLDVVVVIMETCGPFGIGRKITKNGKSAFLLKTSGPATWLDVPAGTTTFKHANTTGIKDVKYEWGHTRP